MHRLIAESGEADFYSLTGNLCPGGGGGGTSDMAMTKEQKDNAAQGRENRGQAGPGAHGAPPTGPRGVSGSCCGQVRDWPHKPLQTASRPGHAPAPPPVPSSLFAVCVLFISVWEAGKCGVHSTCYVALPPPQTPGTPMQ
jgi:hypothetical protein